MDISMLLPLRRQTKPVPELPPDTDTPAAKAPPPAKKPRKSTTEKPKVKEIIDGVIDFAEIGDFLYQPVKKYSSGMRSRLGFAINLCLDPDIFIIDEALSVGDNLFAQKCMNKMDELKKLGKTIIFISHSLPQVRGFCDSAIWIEGGKLMAHGDCNEICDMYANYVTKYREMTPQEKAKLQDDKYRARISFTQKQSFFERYFK